MSTNHTANYNLSQWEPTDQVLRTDFNEDNAKIDAALGALAKTAADHTASIAKLGNCAVQYSTISGNGADSRTYTFPHRPVFVVIADAGSSNEFMVAVRGVSRGYYFHTMGANTVNVSWSARGVTVASTGSGGISNILNHQTSTYYMVALLDAEN